MSFYDRDYYRNDDNSSDGGSSSPFGGMSVIFMLIIANVLVYLANMFLCPHSNFLTYLLAMHDWTIVKPLYWFEFLTYGFAHDPSGFGHILGNMLALFFLGRAVEYVYGKLEFFLFYITAVIIGGLVWGGIHGYDILLEHARSSGIPMLGASGAVCAVVVLFAFNFPKVQVLVFGIIPMPAWVCGVMYVVYDAFGAARGTGSVAHEVHLAGAAFAALYYLSRFQFTDIVKSIKRSQRKKARVRVSSVKSDPHPVYQWNIQNESPVSDSELEDEVNRILRKIKATGEASLTEKERATLIYASREYQKRKNN